MQNRRNSYDELPYDSYAIAATSPIRLSLVSGLHGGPRPPVEGFDALELGCGDGGNLLPLAYYHPSARFMGVDSSQVAIARAREAAAQIGLENARFEIADLARPGALLRKRFDYVIAHGVFSWVNEAVRKGIVTIAARCLRPEGLALVSHNVRAGWQVRTLVREILLDQVQAIEPLAERVRRAKELARKLREIIGETQQAQTMLLAWELERLANSSDSYCFHEYLLEVNRPFHHHEVTAMLRAAGLVYVADSSFNEAAGREPTRIQAGLDELGAAGEAREGLVDFLGWRSFRSSIFCRDGALSPGRPFDRFGELYVAGQLTARDPQPGGDDEVTYVDEKGSTVTASNPLLKAALAAIAELWPRYVRIDALVRIAAGALGPREVGAEAVVSLHRDLDELYRLEVVDLQPVEPRGIGGDVRGGPHALARLELHRGRPLTTPLHSQLQLRDDVQAVLRGGDPERVAECLAAMARWGLTDATAER